jgi:16S rRNA (adenine(1408)-N(1))-methyltransferase
MARATAERLFVGIDANAAGLRDLSSRAARARLPNLIYVRAAVENLPVELAGAADRITVVLPWGSLLAAVARPSVALLTAVRALCRPGAGLTVVLSLATRDRAEALRLDLPSLDEAHVRGTLAAGYAAAGFTVDAVRPLDAGQLARWPSTWARRLAHGRPRCVFQLEARAVDAQQFRGAGKTDRG